MNTDHAHARTGFVPSKPGLRKAHALLAVALLGAAAFSWGCSAFVAGQNQGTQPPGSYTISGTISPSAGGNGATVTLSGAGSATTTANSSGAYSFTGLANGAYTVTPGRSGYTFSPASQN